jgi:two-component system, chemotaxis family, sensor kinase Cph1
MMSENPHCRGTAERLALDGLRILVLEHEALVALDLLSILEKFGATVIGPVVRLSPAMVKAEGQELDAALLDVDLNCERCWPVADTLLIRKVPIVFTTGYEPKHVMPERFAGSPVLIKPCLVEEMIAVLCRVCAGRERHHLSGGRAYDA